MLRKINWFKVIINIVILIPLVAILEMWLLIDAGANERLDTRENGINYVDNIYYQDANSVSSWTPDKLQYFEKGYQMVDSFVREKFQENGGIIVLTNSIPEESVNTVGLFLGIEKIIYISSTNKTENITSTVIHEFGHYIDFELNQAGKNRISEVFNLVKNNSSSIYSRHHLENSSEFFAQTYSIVKQNKESQEEMASLAAPVVEQSIIDFQNQAPNQLINILSMVIYA